MPYSRTVRGGPKGDPEFRELPTCVYPGLGLQVHLSSLCAVGEGG